MKLPITLLACCLLTASTFAAAPAELEGERAAAASVCPSPEEARAKMTVPEGYEVRCFAHEPLVVNPVAMTWDTRGRLWVVEAFEYPEGTPLPVEQRPFGIEAKDDQYHPVPAMCIPTGNRQPGTGNIPKDRVVILEDTDNDGEADKRTVFVEGLNLASAIICGDDGIYVGQQPHLIHFKDSNHDDKPDGWRVILTGFGREDTHELVNSFCWGPDGWLYMTHGVFTNSKVRRPGQPESEGFKFDAGIGRARPIAQPVARLSEPGKPGSLTPATSWEFEVFADGTSNPWGCDYDAAGNFFVSACVIDHFFHMAPGGIYVRQGGAPENPYSYELLPSIVKHRHFRAAYAGVQIYQGGVYPKDTWGHAFIGNIHDNAIHEEVLTPVGSTFKCEPRRDFLRANDGWFRPVSTQTGPDGNLWIMDWCDKYPCYQNAKANPAGVDRDRGRIWRVVRSVVPALAGQKPGSNSPPKGGTTKLGSRPTKDMNLSKLDTPALVKLLGDSNNWMRRRARRELVEKKDITGTKSEIAKLPETVPLATKLESLFALHGMGAADGPLLDKLSTNPDFAVRAWSARLTGETWRSTLMQRAKPEQLSQPLNDLAVNDESFAAARLRLGRLCRDQTLPVRHAVAVALRQWSGGCLTVNRPTLLSLNRSYGVPVIERIFADLAGDEWTEGGPPANIDPFNPNDFPPGKRVTREKGDALLAFAGWQALQPVVETTGSRGWLFRPMHQGDDNPVFRACAQKACREAAERGDPKVLGQILEELSLWVGPSDYLEGCLNGFIKGQDAKIVNPDLALTPILAKWLNSNHKGVRDSGDKLAIMWGDPQRIDILRLTILDDSLPEDKRIEALKMASRVSRALLKDGIEGILIFEGSAPQNLVLEAIRLLPLLPGKSSPLPWAIERWKNLPPIQRTAVAEAILTRPEWSAKLLDAVEAKAINPSTLPMTVARSFAQSKDARLKARAEKLLGVFRESPNDIKALIAAKKKACLEGEPDLANGKILFTATCGVCHTFHGGGQKVGPELIGSGRSNLDALLANVIDPNQIIGNGYENFTITTTDNRTLAGRVIEDTPSHMKLLAIGGAETVVPRDQIASSVNTHQSLMPMGFGNLPDAAFRDIVWYLLSPPEEGPLTAEKKARLSASIDLAPPAKSKGTNWRAIDWESISLWNPQWKVTAPDFERTPVKLAEYHGKTNVLLMHPFPDKKTPASLERKLKIESGKTKLRFSVAADDRGDWRVKALVNGQAVKEMDVDHEQPRWKEVEIDLSKWQGQEVTIRLEGHPSGWSWEFDYWQGIEFKE